MNQKRPALGLRVLTWDTRRLLISAKGLERHIIIGPRRDLL